MKINKQTNNPAPASSPTKTEVGRKIKHAKKHNSGTNVCRGRKRFCGSCDYSRQVLMEAFEAEGKQSTGIVGRRGKTEAQTRMQSSSNTLVRLWRTPRRPLTTDLISNTIS